MVVTAGSLARNTCSTGQIVSFARRDADGVHVETQSSSNPLNLSQAHLVLFRAARLGQTLTLAGGAP